MTAGVVTVIWCAFGLVAAYIGVMSYGIGTRLIEASGASGPHPLQTMGSMLMTVAAAMAWPIGIMLLDIALQTSDSLAMVVAVFAMNSLIWGILAAGVVVLARHLRRKRLSNL